MMNNRAYAIDVLRALAIIGMVLSGQMFWNSELPAWLFHAQLPPPTFVFAPSVPGITWVDLVFPFFLFSMGAAFPLALSRKIEKGDSSVAIMSSIIKRGILLALFAIVLGNTQGYIIRPSVSSMSCTLLLLLTWAMFFVAFVRLPKLSRRANGYLNIGGIAAMILLLVFYKYLLSIDVSIYKSDVIIMILANVVVAGSVLWWFTKRNILLRLGLVVMIIALRITSQIEGSWSQAMFDFTPCSWLYKADYLKYLCVVLPGSICGDLILIWMKRVKEPLVESSKQHSMVAVMLICLLFFLNMWGLFTRHLEINACASLVLGIAIGALLRRGTSHTERLHYKLFCWGWFWLMLGLMFEPYEGGIKKDFATLSYFFVTSGLAAFALIVISYLLNYRRVKMKMLIDCGQNPMVAYTVAAYLIMPLLTLLHVNMLIDWLLTLDPWMGVVRGVIMAALMMIVTSFFTKRKLFWKS